MKESNITLDDIVELRKSADWKERFKAEYYQMKIYCNELEEVICKYNNGTLEFNPAQSIEFFSKQLDAVKQYINILEERARLEKIEL